MPIATARILLRCLAATALLALAWSLTSGPSLANNSQKSWTLCTTAVAEAEPGLRMPTHMLGAISKVESGRWHRQTREILAWPWTVTAGGESRYLPSKAAAIEEVKRLKAKGMRNIDVGCMQINLGYHPDAFASLEQAFDPSANVAYAASFLKELRGRWGSWTRAVGNYHSNTPTLSGRYRIKVFQRLYEAKRAAAKARRAKRLAALQAKS
ncbi:MAG: transglycosylase SLT domain-containing protein [Kiloniellales bacterium]